MVVPVINGADFPGICELKNRLREAIPQISTIVLNINTKKTNVILGDKNIDCCLIVTMIDY